MVTARRLQAACLFVLLFKQSIAVADEDDAFVEVFWAQNQTHWFVQPQLPDGGCAGFGYSAGIGTLVIGCEKTHPIKYDRLLRKSSPNLSVELNKTLTEELSTQLERIYQPIDMYSFYEGSNVKEINTSTVKDILASYEHIFVQARFPGCLRSCRYMHEGFLAAAKTLKGIPNVFFGFLDAVEERQLRTRFQATCDDDCQITFIDTAQNHTTLISEPRSFITLGEKLKRLLKEPILGVHSQAELAKAHTHYERTILLRTSHNSPLYHRVLDFAIKHRDYFHFVQLLDFDYLNVPKDGESLAHLDQEGNVIAVLHDPSVDEDLEAWIYHHNNQPFARIQTNGHVFVHRHPMGKLFVHDETKDDEMAPFLPLADEFKGQISFVTISHHVSGDIQVVGLCQDSVPAFIITDELHSNTGNVYPLMKHQVTPDDVREHTMRYIRGELTPAKRTECWREGDELSQVPGMLKVVHHTFDWMVLDATEDVFVFVYDSVLSFPWGKALKTVRMLVRTLQDVTGVRLYGFELLHNHFNSSLFGMETPAEEHVILHGWSSKSESGERVKTPVYQGPFTLKRVLMWMKKHSARVQSAWDVISQTGNSAIKEARELATAVPVTTTERPREHPVDVFVTDDGQVVLRPLTRKIYAKIFPQSGDRVYVDYRVAMEGDTSSGVRQTRELTFGQDPVIECLELSLQQMRSGDTALVICGPDYMKGATAEEQAVIAEAQEQNARVLVHVDEITFAGPHDEL